MITEHKSKYPVYVISKGRYDNCPTVYHLEKIGQPFKLVVEPCEYDAYTRVTSKENILKLPFDNLGQGSIPARNWCWEHSLSLSHAKHWILDDNIYGFYRLNRNLRVRVRTSSIFRCAEDFTDRYTNVGLSGFNYRQFAKSTSKLPPYYLNTRVYSCILVDNSLPFRWRGRYNEDTDLSLRVLKEGLCTILFNAFLAAKAATMTMKGGNTDNVYTDGDDRLKFAESLRDQHPDVVKVVRRFNRWHHLVDYSKFQKENSLIRREEVQFSTEIDNYGMVLLNDKY